MADALQVELVSADRVVWSGEATMVVARTTDGEMGVLKDHAPVLSVLVPSAVEIVTDDERLYAVIDGGFISVANNRLSVLAEHAQMANEVDLEQARRDLEEAEANAETPQDAALLLAQARVTVGEKAR
ncbi:MAG TPA: F0F1 ATP synthase subunit epsilon [Nocardioidaceae bacterium]|jgi:F-type H+-transporting ATPase subunit epsilon